MHNRFSLTGKIPLQANHGGVKGQLPKSLLNQEAGEESHDFEEEESENLTQDGGDQEVHLNRRLEITLSKGVHENLRTHTCL